MPNTNMLYGIDSVGCYSPLAIKAYRDSLEPFEMVDDSLGLRSPSPHVTRDHVFLARLLNVKYVISAKRLSSDSLRIMKEEKGVYLYTLDDFFPRVFYVETLSGIDKGPAYSDVTITRYESGLAEVKLNAEKDGFVVFSESYYPGWRVYVDGKVNKLLKANNLIQAVKVGLGEHYVRFVYSPELSAGKID